MTISNDLLEAKRSLSASHLRGTGPRESFAPRYRMARAVACAGNQVHGVGVGHKIVNGQQTSTLCVRLHVAQKLSRSALTPQNLLPEAIDGVPTDVLESVPAMLGSIPARRRRFAADDEACSAGRQSRQRPVVAGISVAQVDVTAGTIAAICRSTRAGEENDRYLLSNNHVLANVNQAEIGDDVLQPGPADGGGAADRVATLHRFIPIQADGGSTANQVDAAVARLLDEIEADAQVCTIGALAGTEEAAIDMPVRKHGRTTGLTEGIVSDEAFDALVGLDPDDPQAVALFEDQLRIEAAGRSTAFGLGGDSGSLIVHRTRRRAVGLFFAGPPGGMYGIANRFEVVAQALEIELAC